MPRTRRRRGQRPPLTSLRPIPRPPQEAVGMGTVRHQPPVVLPGRGLAQHHSMPGKAGGATINVYRAKGEGGLVLREHRPAVQGRDQRRHAALQRECSLRRHQFGVTEITAEKKDRLALLMRRPERKSTPPKPFAGGYSSAMAIGQSHWWSTLFPAATEKEFELPVCQYQQESTANSATPV